MSGVIIHWEIFPSSFMCQSQVSEDFHDFHRDPSSLASLAASTSSDLKNEQEF